MTRFKPCSQPLAFCAALILTSIGCGADFAQRPSDLEPAVGTRVGVPRAQDEEEEQEQDAALGDEQDDAGLATRNAPRDAAPSVPMPMPVAGSAAAPVPCPTTCPQDAWSQWDACSAECEGGSQTRTCSVTPTSEGTRCDRLIEAQRCNPQACVEVHLVSPANGSISDLGPTFTWSLTNASSRTACPQVRLDKGSNPFDSGIEESFNAEPDSQRLRVNLNPFYFDGARFEWGVRVQLCELGQSSCPCTGQSSDSDPFVLTTIQ